MYLLAFKSFIRSRSVIVALVLFLAMGLVSILIGKQFLEKRLSAQQAVTKLQKEQIARNAEHIPDQFGLLMYYLRFAYINPTEPVAALAIGQQDVNTSIQYLTIRGLEAQRYDTDLNNPYQLQSGNFDLSFVILFLVPLLIIVLCFNLLSQEKEAGTWSLVRVQSRQSFSVLWQKLIIRYATVIVLLAVLLMTAVIIIGIPADGKLAAYALTSVLYVTCWFALCWLVISLHKSSSMNALLLLSIWVFLCLLIPAALNNYITARYPIKEAYSTFLKQRDGYHTKWDISPDSTMKAFFRHYPQFKEYVWNSPKFNYMWYYAMQQSGDDEAAEDSRAMFQQLARRQILSRNAARFFPAMQAQLQFTDIAGTGLQQHLTYLDSTALFHERLRLHFYPKIFGDSLVATENWQQHIPEYHKAPVKCYTAEIIVPFLIMIATLIIAGKYLFERS